VSSTQIFILTVAVGLMVALWLFIEHSKMGRGHPGDRGEPRDGRRCSASTSTA
jgi:hypothetical protein